MSMSATASPIVAVWQWLRNPAFWVPATDLFAVLTALALPWSTSLVGIFTACWLGAAAFTFDYRVYVKFSMRPICALPSAFVVLAVIGTLWSDASWAERIHAIAPTLKLMFIPALLFHFQRSSRGMWVFIAFFASCTLLMLLSWIVAFEPGLALKPDAQYGVPVKNYIDQSQEFALCAVAPAFLVIALLRTGKIWQAALLAAIALSFVVNMMFVSVSRTALVTMPIMLAVFALLHLKWRASLAIFAAAIVLAALAWVSSPKLQWTTETFLRDYDLYKQQDEPTSIGIRLEFWNKSLRFLAEAPVIGHGTGSTRGLFEKVSSGRVVGDKVFASGKIIGNPHNQTLNVAVQWGVVGVIILYAMWLYHFLLFRGEGLMAWIGLLVVVQNFFTSLFNSHLFDVHEGWMYVLGVGVAGGTLLGDRLRAAAAMPEGAVRP
jgi:O-antigen ligase